MIGGLPSFICTLPVSHLSLHQPSLSLLQDLPLQIRTFTVRIQIWRMGERDGVPSFRRLLESSPKTDAIPPEEKRASYRRFVVAGGLSAADKAVREDNTRATPQGTIIRPPERSIRHGPNTGLLQGPSTRTPA